MRSMLWTGMLLLVACDFVTTQQAEPIIDAGRDRGDAQLVFTDAGHDAATADAAVADTWLQDAQVADTRVADARQPDAAQPDSARPDTTQPDQVSPDTAVPDTAATDTATPDAAVPDTAQPDLGQPDAAQPDTAQADAGANPCDQDQDTYLDEGNGCGGNDCNDQNASVHPGATEICSFTDENCAGGNNEGLTCEFYAVTANQRHRIDPFARTALYLEVTLPSISIDVALYDIDTDLNGDLIAVTAWSVYRLESSGTLTEISNPALPPLPNGLAIDGAGAIHISNSDGVDSKMMRLNRQTGGLTTLATLSPYASSGDCVFLDDGTLLMTSPNLSDPINGEDLLVRVNPTTGVVTEIGPMGYTDVWGLSAAWGYLFGVTGNGEVLLINPGTGTGTLLVSFVDGNQDPVEFYGASSVR
ncbi:MAG: MopE-related protein [Pseudomonadota bacterium]